MSVNIQINPHHNIRLSEIDDGTCEVVARSPHSGEFNAIVVAKSARLLAREIRNWKLSRRNFDECVPNLDDTETDFILSGVPRHEHATYTIYE